MKNRLNLKTIKVVNKSLEKNIFITFIGIITGIPIILSGLQGTAKSIILEILFDSLIGEKS